MLARLALNVGAGPCPLLGPAAHRAFLDAFVEAVVELPAVQRGAVVRAGPRISHSAPTVEFELKARDEADAARIARDQLLSVGLQRGFAAAGRDMAWTATIAIKPTPS